MKRCNGVAMLELRIQGHTLCPTLIRDEENTILVDAGMPGQLDQIRVAMEELGVPFANLKAIIITHQDLDHIAGIPDIRNNLTHDIDIYAHELDKPYIEGTFPLLKGDRTKIGEEAWNRMPAALQFLYTHTPTSPVTHTLEDNQELPYCGGIRIITTPGHTDGHICLYLKQNKTLIAGDAMVCVNGQLQGPMPPATLNMNVAMESLKKLRDFDIEKVICYHGGLCSTNVKEQIEELTRE